MTPAIAMEKVSAGYRGLRADVLHDFSLTVAPGEAFALRGGNGVGKSTVLKVLGGLLRPTAGAVHVFGIDAMHAQARLGVGFVTEIPALPALLTPLEILETGVVLHERQVEDRRRHCLAWLDRLNLGAVAERRVEGFSKGMLQRVALAHALAVSPKLLVLDEPLSGLDPEARQSVVDLLVEFKQAGGSILLTSHVSDDVDRLADRCGVLADGRLTL